MMLQQLPQRRSRRRPRQQPPTLLRDRVDETYRSAEILAGRAESLQLKIESVRANILQEKRKKRNYGGVKATLLMNQQARKLTMKLQARLDHASTRNEKARSRNNAIKNEIDALRRERMIFETTLHKLQSEFQSKQDEMAALIDASNLFQESREEALRMLSALRNADEAERQKHKWEWDTLTALVEGQAEKQKHVMGAGLRQRAIRLEEQLSIGDLDPEEEALIRAKLSRLSAKAKSDADAARRAQSEYLTYEEAFGELKRVGESDDIGELVESFLAVEDSNFRLFDVIANTNIEIEQIEVQKRQTEELMHKYKHDQGKYESNRKRHFLQMSERLEHVRKLAAQAEERRSMAEQTMQQLGEATDRLFLRIGCDRMSGMESFRDPLVTSPGKRLQAADRERLERKHADNKHEDRHIHPPPLTKSASLILQLGSKVDEDNVMLYLGLVEQRADELAQRFRRFVSEQSLPNRNKAIADLATHGPSAPSRYEGMRLSVEPPSLEEHTDELGRRRGQDLSRPLTKRELRENALSKGGFQIARNVSQISGGTISPPLLQPSTTDLGTGRRRGSVELGRSAVQRTNVAVDFSSLGRAAGQTM